MMNINDLGRISTSLAGCGTLSDMQRATSPRGMLQWICDFFTFGGVRKENVQQYEALMKSLADALIHADISKGQPIPEKISLENINGYSVTFTMPGENNPMGDVMLEVRQGNSVVSEQISQSTWINVCKTIQLRQQFGLLQLAPLTESGKMNLSGCYLRNADMSGYDLSMADLSGACLIDANLSGVNLYGADLTEADLSGACLKGADLREANLREADLRRADLREAKVANTDLTGARTRGIITG